MVPIDSQRPCGSNPQVADHHSALLPTKPNPAHWHTLAHPAVCQGEPVCQLSAQAIRLSPSLGSVSIDSQRPCLPTDESHSLI